MPIYEYICNDCGKCFDALRSMSKADAPIPCESCESLSTNRKISAAFAHSGGRVLAGSSGGCGSCSKTSCGSCSG